MILLVFEQQLRHIHLHAVLIALLFFRELKDLEVGATDDVAHLQELRRLAFVNAVDAELVSCPRGKNVPERFFGGGDQT